MAITVAQTASGSEGALTFVQHILANTTTGNTLVAVVSAYASGGPLTVSGVAADVGTSVFTQVIAQAGTTVYSSVEAWAAPNITGGSTPTITATLSGTSTIADIVIYELAGMPTTTITDGTASGKIGTTATACTAPSITTTNAGSITFAVFGPSQSMTAGAAGWTAVIGTGAASLSEYKIQTTTQSGLVQTATQGPTGTYSAIAFSLQPPSSGTVPSLSVNPKIYCP